MSIEKDHKLLNEDPLLVLPSLAKIFSLNEAIMLQQIHYWLTINRHKKNNGGNYRNGYFWTYNSVNKWQSQFPFWHTSTIRRTLQKLEAREIVVSDRYNRLNLDRTKWYRLDYARLKEVCPFVHNGLIELTKLAQSGEATDLTNMGKPIPETNYTENTTEIRDTPLKDISNESEETYVVGKTLKDNKGDALNTGSSSFSALSGKSTENERTFKENTLTHGELIEAFLCSHGSAAIKAISEGTGINRNTVNITLHNGKGKRFQHLPEKRAWCVAEKYSIPVMANVNSPVTKCQDYTTTRKVKVDAYLKTNGPSRPVDIAQAIGVETKKMYKFFDRHKAYYENPEYGLWKLKNVNLNSGSTSEVILTSPDTNENKL